VRSWNVWDRTTINSIPPCEHLLCKERNAGVNQKQRLVSEFVRIDHVQIVPGPKPDLRLAHDASADIRPEMEVRAQ